METHIKNLKLVPMAIFVFIALIVRKNPYLDQAQELNITIGLVVLSLVFTVWYLSKKECRDSYKNATMNSKLIMFAVAMVSVVGVYLFLRP